MSSETILSYEPAPPEDMGFFVEGYKKLEAKEDRKKVIKEAVTKKAVEDVEPSPPIKMREDERKEDEKKEELDVCYIWWTTFTSMA